MSLLKNLIYTLYTSHHQAICSIRAKVVLAKRDFISYTEEIISDITFIYRSLVKLTFKFYSLMVRGSYGAGFYCFLPMHARIRGRRTDLSSLFITEKILKAGTWASSVIVLLPLLSCLRISLFIVHKYLLSAACVS